MKVPIKNRLASYASPSPSSQTVPLGAAAHFFLLVVHSVVWRRRFRIRALRDYLLLVASVLCMGIAYLFQDDLKYCVGPNSLFQGHAIWHAGMALGIGFFYLFLRQEREVRDSSEG